MPRPPTPPSLSFGPPPGAARACGRAAALRWIAALWRAVPALAVLLALMLAGLAQGAAPARQAVSHAEGPYLLAEGILPAPAKEAPAGPAEDAAVPPQPTAGPKSAPAGRAGTRPAARHRPAARRDRPAARAPPGRAG